MAKNSKSKTVQFSNGVRVAEYVNTPAVAEMIEMLKSYNIWITTDRAGSLEAGIADTFTGDRGEGWEKLMNRVNNGRLIYLPEESPRLNNVSLAIAGRVVAEYCANDPKSPRHITHHSVAFRDEDTGEICTMLCKGEQSETGVVIEKGGRIPGFDGLYWPKDEGGFIGQHLFLSVNPHGKSIIVVGPEDGEDEDGNPTTNTVVKEYFYKAGSWGDFGEVTRYNQEKTCYTGVYTTLNKHNWNGAINGTGIPYMVAVPKETRKFFAEDQEFNHLLEKVVAATPATKKAAKDAVSNYLKAKGISVVDEARLYRVLSYAAVLIAVQYAGIVIENPPFWTLPFLCNQIRISEETLENGGDVALAWETMLKKNEMYNAKAFQSA